MGNEPDRQWITIDDNPGSPHYNRVYAMWVDFHTLTPVPFVSFADARADGTHTNWSAPQALPEPPHTPQGATYLLPHVAPDGSIYTTVTNFNPKQGFCCTSAFVDKSTDGGMSWSVVGAAFSNVTPPPAIYPNTMIRDGIENTFTVGNHLDAQGRYPLYVAYEDFSAGVDNVLLTASYDGGATWTSPIQVNDNASRAGGVLADLARGQARAVTGDQRVEDLLRDLAPQVLGALRSRDPSRIGRSVRKKIFKNLVADADRPAGQDVGS